MYIICSNPEEPHFAAAIWPCTYVFALHDARKAFSRC